MLTDQALLVLIFKGINLGIILALAVHGYRNHLKHLLKKTLHDLQTTYQHLQRAKNALDEQHYEIDRRAHTQQHMTEELSRKVQQWHATIVRQKQTQEQDAQVLQKHLNKQYQRQQRQIVIDHLRKQIGTRIIREMQDELTDTFTNTARATDYLRTVTESMKDHA